MDTPHSLSYVDLSTRNLLPFGAQFTARVAAACGCQSVDIELARPRMGGAAAAARLNAHLETPAAVWISLESVMDGDRGLVGVAWERWRKASGPLIVVDAPDRSEETHTAIVAAYRAAERLSRRGLSCQLAVGLRGSALVGGRRHLTALTLLRRRAEEWGVGVALDLTGSWDPYWEAEAAVLRLGERLVLIRANAAVTLPAATGWPRVSRRAVRAAMEQSPAVRLSLEPSVGWWQLRSVRALAESWSGAALRTESWRAPLVPDAFRLADEEPGWRFSPPR